MIRARRRPRRVITPPAESTSRARPTRSARTVATGLAALVAAPVVALSVGYADAAPADDVRVVQINAVQARFLQPLCRAAFALKANDNRLRLTGLSRDDAVAACIQVFHGTRLTPFDKVDPPTDTPVPPLDGVPVPPVRVVLDPGVTPSPTTPTTTPPAPTTTTPAPTTTTTAPTTSTTPSGSTQPSSSAQPSSSDPAPSDPPGGTTTQPPATGGTSTDPTLGGSTGSGSTDTSGSLGSASLGSDSGSSTLGGSGSQISLGSSTSDALSTSTPIGGTDASAGAGSATGITDGAAAAPPVAGDPAGELPASAAALRNEAARSASTSKAAPMADSENDSGPSIAVVLGVLVAAVGLGLFGREVVARRARAAAAAAAGSGTGSGAAVVGVVSGTAGLAGGGTGLADAALADAPTGEIPVVDPPTEPLALRRPSPRPRG